MSLVASNRTLAFGSQEWFAEHAIGSVATPIGSRVGVISVNEFRRICSVQHLSFYNVKNNIPVRHILVSWTIRDDWDLRAKEDRLLML